MRRRLAFAVAAAAAATACTSTGPAADCSRLPSVRAGVCIEHPEARRAAPVDEVERVGEGTLSLAAFAGQPVVVNFWASWCAPCRVEQPVLNEAAELLDGEVAFVGVAIQDSQAGAQGHAAEFAIPYPSLFDPASAFAAQFRGVGPRSIPSTIFLDRQGRVAVRLFGTLVDATEIVVLATRLAEEPL